MQENRVSGTRMAIPPVGISGIAYYVGESAPIDELTCMKDDPALLHRFKRALFKTYSRSSISLAEQAVIAVEESLRKTGLTARDIDAVVIGSSELNTWPGYPEGLSTEILRALELNHLLVVGVTLAGCANAASSLRVARDMIAVEGYRNVLVIETNRLHDDRARLVGAAPGEVPVNVFGDGAVSFIVTTGPADFDVLSMNQLVSIHPNPAASKHEAIAKNISSGRHVIDAALDRSGLSREEIHCVVLGNVNFMMMLGELNAFGFPKANFFTDNIGKHGHIWSADNFINLHDYCEKKSPPAGSLFLLVAQGSSYYSAVVCRKNFS